MILEDYMRSEKPECRLAARSRSLDQKLKSASGVEKLAVRTK